MTTKIPPTKRLECTFGYKRFVTEHLACNNKTSATDSLAMVIDIDNQTEQWIRYRGKSIPALDRDGYEVEEFEVKPRGHHVSAVTKHTAFNKVHVAIVWQIGGKPWPSGDFDSNLRFCVYLTMNRAPGVIYTTTKIFDLTEIPREKLVGERLIGYCALHNDSETPRFFVREKTRIQLMEPMKRYSEGVVRVVISSFPVPPPVIDPILLTQSSVPAQGSNETQRFTIPFRTNTKKEDTAQILETQHALEDLSVRGKDATQLLKAQHGLKNMTLKEEDEKVKQHTAKGQKTNERVAQEEDLGSPFIMAEEDMDVDAEDLDDWMLVPGRM